MDLHPVTEIQGLFFPTNLGLLGSMQHTLLSFYVDMYTTNAFKNPLTYFKTRSSMFTACYRKIVAKKDTKYTAGSEHVLTKFIAGVIPDKSKILITDIFENLDVSNCPITDIGIDVDFKGTALADPQKSAFQISGTESFTAVSEMAQISVTIWAKNGVDKVYSPKFKLAVQLHECVSKVPSVSSIKIQILANDV